ncbi:PREDICTED: erythroferrone-like [Nanorana parkeri]|uniref:erythroferrone-like n=1 Tax=Nanorana parkeri TaxID=125878 RepID=UPI000854C302|nr:PREDICTED: erythroferrone-like [Nanorana parkeri]
MDAHGKPIPLRCLLMTISMGVLLVLLCAGPACTHKNRGPKFQDASATVLPSQGIPVLTPPKGRDSTSDMTDKKRPPWPSSYTWLMFSDHAEKTKRKRQEESLRQHHSGPVGAPAPPKHQSHPVNHVLREKKLSQFLQLLSDALLKRKDGENTSNYKRAPAIPPAKVHIAFTCKTSSDIHVDPGKLKELQLYEMSHLEGSFYRGAGLNLTSGRYTAPYTGLYAFFARLHIDFQKNTHEGVEGSLRMQLCILSFCQDNLSLEHVLSYTANEVTATITLNGVLQIQAGQYVSLFLENKMDSWIVTVIKGSDFSGVLLGQ